MADRDDEYVRVDERVVIEVEQGRDPQDPATIRTDIHETRERMSHTIEELSERLNPDHLKAQVKENVREATIGRAEHMAQKAVSRVSETRHSMMDTLRDNPLPAALMGIGLGWMLWNGRKQEQERFAGDVAYQTYGRYPQTGYRYGSGGYGTTGGYAAGGYGATGAYGGSGGYRYEEDEPGVAERARDKAGDLRDRAGDVAESARDTVSDLADRTRDAAGDAAERARMAAESLARETRYRTHRLEDRFQETLMESPLVLGAAAVVLGMAAGLSAPATRREVELMGATRDQLFDRAKEAASEAGEKVQAVAERVVGEAIAAEMYTKDYADVFAGDARWQSLPTPAGDTFEWDPDSTYVRKPPYFDDMPAEPAALTDITGARVLAKLGDSVTTDHISPAGAIKKDSPAGHYLAEHGVEQRDFNSYGSRRGNHEVMIRGTFANIRLRNQLAPGTEGGVTRNFAAEGEVTSIYEASVAYAAQGTPLVVLAGKEYGSGSSRDWAAKGTALLGVRAVIAESYERIHRSNLIGMGVLPLQYPDGQSAETLGLTGEESLDITGVEALADAIPATVHVRAGNVEFDAVLRIDTPGEASYYRHGGIMQYVLRSLRG